MIDPAKQGGKEGREARKQGNGEKRGRTATAEERSFDLAPFVPQGRQDDGRKKKAGWTHW